MDGKTNGKTIPYCIGEESTDSYAFAVKYLLRWLFIIYDVQIQKFLKVFEVRLRLMITA